MTLRLAVASLVVVASLLVLWFVVADTAPKMVVSVEGVSEHPDSTTRYAMLTVTNRSDSTFQLLSADGMEAIHDDRLVIIGVFRQQLDDGWTNWYSERKGRVVTFGVQPGESKMLKVVLPEQPDPFFIGIPCTKQRRTWHPILEDLRRRLLKMLPPNDGGYQFWCDEPFGPSKIMRTNSSSGISGVRSFRGR